MNEDEFVVTSPHFDDFAPELVPLPDLSDMPLSSDDPRVEEASDLVRPRAQDCSLASHWLLTLVQICTGVPTGKSRTAGG